MSAHCARATSATGALPARTALGFLRSPAALERWPGAAESPQAPVLDSGSGRSTWPGRAGAHRDAGNQRHAAGCCSPASGVHRGEDCPRLSRVGADLRLGGHAFRGPSATARAAPWPGHPFLGGHRPQARCSYGHQTAGHSGPQYQALRMSIHVPTVVPMVRFVLGRLSHRIRPLLSGVPHARHQPRETAMSATRYPASSNSCWELWANRSALTQNDTTLSLGVSSQMHAHSCCPPALYVSISVSLFFPLLLRSRDRNSSKVRS